MSVVAELRARANARHSGEEPSPTAALCAEAAGRIETLERALATYQSDFRDRAALAALTGLITQSDKPRQAGELAKEAYAAADAMMMARGS